MSNEYQEKDNVFSLEEFQQFEQFNRNVNARIPIFFCIDTSGSMQERIGILETRLSLLSKVMRKLLENMKGNPILSERAVIGIITYNNKAVLNLSALDLCVVDIFKVTDFYAEGQTIFSLGLSRSLQAIDHYREGIRRSDNETFTPMLIFMTDGQPIGDDDQEIENVYNEIWKRINNNDLYVFSVGISKDANMDYVKALRPDHIAHQMINETDFESVFSEIESIINKGNNDSHAISDNINTKDTSSTNSFDFDYVLKITQRNLQSN